MEILRNPMFWAIAGAVVGGLVFTFLAGPAGPLAGKFIAEVLYIAAGALLGGSIGFFGSSMHGQIQLLRTENSRLKSQLVEQAENRIIGQLKFERTAGGKGIRVLAFNANNEETYRRSSSDVGVDTITPFAQSILQDIGRDNVPANMTLRFADDFPPALANLFIQAFRNDGYHVSR